MSADAARIAELAAASPAPPDEPAAAPPGATEAWREIAAAARGLEDDVELARAPGVALSFEESAVMMQVGEWVADLHREAELVAGRIAAQGAELDAAAVVRRIDSVERLAGRAADALAYLAACQVAEPARFRPPPGTCETLDPEFAEAIPACHGF